MSATPPELPPLPAQPRPAGSFVTVIGWIAFALALLGAFYGLTQVLGGLFMPKDFYLRMMNPAGQPMSLPPLMRWFYTHTLLIGIVELVLSSLFAWVAWNLLKRRDWARIAFIAFLLLGMAWQLGSLWMMRQMVEGMLAAQNAAMPPGQAMPEEFAETMTNMAMLMGSAVGLLIAALLGGVAWKLCTRKVRTEFLKGGHDDA
ncbi:MAG TPA: hypothetical protein VFF96_02175 [Pseudoxanthomonas sp.]|nr:hypothetical protein [Pseudoxanthomonas sp.]